MHGQVGGISPDVPPRQCLVPTYEVQERDVTYRADGSQSLLARIYQPAGSGPFPALIKVPGGAWRHATRTANAHVDRALAESGLVVVSIDTRSSDLEPYPASVADVNFATRWLKAHAGEFNARPDAVGGLGYSSGGHLIVLSAMRPRDPRYAAIPLPDAADVDASLAYVLLAWPGADPYALYRKARAAGDEGVNIMAYFQDDDTLQEANPQLILERDEAVELPSALLLQGARDDVVIPAMNAQFVSTYSRAGGRIELAMFPGEGHSFTGQSGPSTSRAIDLMRSFIARQLAAIAAGW